MASPHKRPRVEAASPPSTARGAEIRRKLHAKAKIYGTCSVSTSPKFPAALKSAGIDVIFIDTEHVPIVRDTLSWMCRTYGALGIPPLCRVPEPEPYRVCEYLDAGACGIVAPYLETVDQVKMLIGATKLRPLKGEKLQYILDNLTPIDKKDGVRSTEALYEQVDKILGESRTSTFMRKKNADNFLLLNIESVAAVSRLEEFASIPGVDGFLVGPHDLSCNYGVPEQWESSEFLSAIDRIIDVSNEYSLGCGIHYSFAHQIEYQAKWSNRGANIIMHSVDYKLAQERLLSDLTAIRKLTGDVNEGQATGEVEGV